ncbi:MAG: acyl-CoA dehydrogenase [Acidimicrobiia bacterium]|nr:acyl-CoA dehydrogenase [Acidimicrobiia bacterium]
MNFDLSEDQDALRDGIRSLCEGRFTSERVRKGFDRAVFDELANTGVFSLRADGFTWADAAITFEELGRAVVPGPLVWSHLGHGLVDGVLTGLTRPAPGVDAIVEHLATADAVLVLDETGIECIAADALTNATAHDWPLDPLTPVHRVAVLPKGEHVAGPEVAGEWRRGGAVLTSAFQMGMAQACTEAATQYSLGRFQFDRPIGSFQAVKHILADMVVRAEVARAAVHAAAVTLDDPEVGDLERAISGARLLAGEAALKNAKSSLQVHGGVGFTWEYDVHLYLKRAWVLNTTFGTAAEHGDALAARL